MVTKADLMQILKDSGQRKSAAQRQRLNLLLIHLIAGLSNEDLARMNDEIRDLEERKQQEETVIADDSIDPVTELQQPASDDDDDDGGDVLAGIV